MRPSTPSPRPCGCTNLTHEHETPHRARFFQDLDRRNTSKASIAQLHGIDRITGLKWERQRARTGGVRRVRP